MKKRQIAAQLYTVRDLLKTQAGTIETLTRLRDIGYPAVQISGFSYDVMQEEAIRDLCAKLGLVICATHEGSNEILEHPEAVVARLDKLGCRYTAYPYPVDIDLTSEEHIARLIRRLDAAGRVLAASGKVLCYHNHHQEFRKLNGRILLDRIYTETDPALLQGEIDTYWVQFGGGNPESWVRRLKGRSPLIHLKDYVVNSNNVVMFTEVGNGVLDFAAIISAADEAGCEWFIVEQDTCPGDPVDALAISFRYLSGLADK